MLGLFQHGTGRVGLYGDSNCLDSSHSRSKCFKLLGAMLAWAAGGVSWGCGLLLSHGVAVHDCWCDAGCRHLRAAPCGFPVGTGLDCWHGARNPDLPAADAQLPCSTTWLQDVPALTPPSAQLTAPHGNFVGLPSRRTDYNFTEVRSARVEGFASLLSAVIGACMRLQAPVHVTSNGIPPLPFSSPAGVPCAAAPAQVLPQLAAGAAGRIVCPVGRGG